MKQTLWILNIISLTTILSTGCGADKENKDVSIPEKIEFPTVAYTISSSADTTLFGPQGTRIFIGSETFQFEDGRPATDSITIELKEFYNKEDIILADLATISGDRLLETGGMIYIDASSNGEKLEINKNERIVVHFPKEQNDYRSMNLFFADETATDSSVQNWTVDTIDLVKTTVTLSSYGYTWLSHDDSTDFEYIPKNYVDTGYYWSPLDFHVNQFDFSKQAMEEISNYTDRLEIDFVLTKKGKITKSKVNANVTSVTNKEIIKFMNTLPEFEPCKDKNGVISNLDGHITIAGGNIIPIYKSDSKYITSFNSKYSKFENSPIKNMNDAELSYYMFSVSKLGWINCDRFIDTEETIDLLAQTPVNPGTKLKMVFSDIDGVLIAVVNDGKYTFSKVPVGRQVTIIGIKNDNGQFSTAFKEITISDKPLDVLTFEETTLANLREKLEKI